MGATVKRHSIRGGFYGVLLGLGLMLTAVGQGMAALGTWPPFLLLVAGPVLGILWARFAPAKGGPPPGAESAAADNEPADDTAAEETSEETSDEGATEIT